MWFFSLLIVYEIKVVILAVPQKVQHRVAVWRSYSHLSYIPKRTGNICSQMFILFIRVKKWKQAKCLLIDEWINKMWHILTMEYYIAIEKEWSTNTCYNMDETWKRCVKWKKPVTKDHILWYHLYEMSRIGKSIGRNPKTESKLVVAKR